MKKPIALGKYIIADPRICHGKPTFKGSRVMVWQVLRAVERGQPWDEICVDWRGAVTRDGIEEALHLAGNVLMEPSAVPTVAKALCHTATA